MTTAPHPLVAKAAADWQALAARHGVKITINPMSPDTYPDGLIIKFETGRADEYGHALIFPPRYGARRIRQTLMTHGYRIGKDRSMHFGPRNLTRALFINCLVEDWARRARLYPARELVAA